MTRLELAQQKFYKRRNYEPPYHMEFNDFVVECFLDYSPSSYGKYIQDKIISSCCQGEVRMKKLSDKENNGDCQLVYPYEPFYEEYNKDGKIYNFNFLPSEKFIVKENYEIKVSYLGKNSYYTLRNLRPYQNLVGGYIICLIDCEMDFTPNFYVVDESFISRNLTLSHMNGVSSEHRDGNFENYGASIADGSCGHLALKENNRLGGTTLEDLISYLKGRYPNMKKQFVKNKDGIFAEFNEGCQKFFNERNGL